MFVVLLGEVLRWQTVVSHVGWQPLVFRRQLLALP